MPPAGNGDTNNAVLGIAQPVIFTIQTADLYLHLDKPASSIEFNITYDPRVFRFLPGSAQCALPWSSLDTSKPGIVGFKFMSQDDESVTATVVSFSFAPLMAVTSAGFIANGLVTDTKATLIVPTVNVTVQLTPTHSSTVFPLNPGYPPMGMPLPVPPFGLPPMPAPPMLGMPYYILPLYLR